MKKLILALLLLPSTVFAQERVDTGMLSMYWFLEGSGDTVNDYVVSSVPLNLRIQDPGNVSWVPDGGLTVNSATIIASELIPGWDSKIMDSGELSVELWIESANDGQFGPARIAAYTVDPRNTGGNFVMGQSYGEFDCRLKTSVSDKYGKPSMMGDMPSGITHLVMTKKGTTTTLYVNGEQVSSNNSTGQLSNWAHCGFALANEHIGTREWLGTFYFFGISEHAFTAQEVQTNFEFGYRYDGEVPPPPDPPIRVPTATNYTWTAPTTGTEAVKYEVQGRSEENQSWVTLGEVPSIYYTYHGFSGVWQQIRVSGIDIEDRQGPWSEPSDEYAPPVPDLGPPGKPGKPERVQ